MVATALMVRLRVGPMSCVIEAPAGGRRICECLWGGLCGMLTARVMCDVRCACGAIFIIFYYAYYGS